MTAPLAVPWAGNCRPRVWREEPTKNALQLWPRFVRQDAGSASCEPWRTPFLGHVVYTLPARGTDHLPDTGCKRAPSQISTLNFNRSRLGGFSNPFGLRAGANGKFALAGTRSRSSFHAAINGRNSRKLGMHAPINKDGPNELYGAVPFSQDHRQLYEPRNAVRRFLQIIF